MASLCWWATQHHTSTRPPGPDETVRLRHRVPCARGTRSGLRVYGYFVMLPCNSGIAQHSEHLRTTATYNFLVLVEVLPFCQNTSYHRVSVSGTRGNAFGFFGRQSIDTNICNVALLQLLVP